jgi:aminoglycoside phosphotransferase (APT) family kinase protein
MAAAYDHGVRVAKVRYLCEDPAVLGLPFFIMDFVEGISIGRKVIQEAGLAGARAVLPEQMAEQLARIHTLNADPLDFLPRPQADEPPTRIFVRRAYDMLDALGVKSPAFEFLLRWADQHAPDAPAITFVHGDFRVGNLLVDSGGLAAVIDWEFAHIGDPREELGYLCMRDWRFGADHLHAGGLAPRERLLRAYETASGRTIDRAAVDWWEIAGNIFWGITCLAQADRHLSGRDPSVELASLGRRSVEMQMEALRLIGKVGI